MKAVLATPALIDTELPEPTPGPRDLLVRIEAVAVNPVDSKVRGAITAGEGPKQLGWDAAGVVTAVGAPVVAVLASRSPETLESPTRVAVVVAEIGRASCRERV